MKSNYHDTHAWTRYKEDVARAACGNWDVVLGALAPALGPALERAPRHVACPRHNGTDGFRFYSNFRETGGGVCNTCSSTSRSGIGWHDGFAILMWINGWGFVETVRAVGEKLGIREPERPAHARVHSVGPTITPAPAVPLKSQEQIEREDAQRAKRLNEAWTASLDLLDPKAAPVRSYFVGRGITPVYGPLDDLRFHEALPYYDGPTRTGTYPALLSLLRCPDGSGCTLHRTYLTPDGHKAPVEANRKLMPRRSAVQLRGAAVRLDHLIKSVLCVGEGIETCLAWRVLTGLPTWASTVAGVLEEIEPPESVRIVIVATDKDRSGRGDRAADALAANLKQRGIFVLSYPPPFEIPEGNPKGLDWADVLQAFGAEAGRAQPCIQNLLSGLHHKLLQMGLTWDDAACRNG